MMTDDGQDFFNKSIGKLEKEIIALKKEYQAECHRADELEDSLQKSWQNESKLKELLSKCLDELAEFNNSYYPKTQELFSQITSTIGEKK